MIGLFGYWLFCYWVICYWVAGLLLLSRAAFRFELVKNEASQKEFKVQSIRLFANWIGHLVM